MFFIVYQWKKYKYPYFENLYFLTKNKYTEQGNNQFKSDY